VGTTENVGLAGIDGYADVDGARLSYRLVNPDSNGPTLVFENGWGASWHYWVWLERALGNRCRMLFYDRAGIGGSSVCAPLSAAGITWHFKALLNQLGIENEVIAVGHSFGGLMVGLHAAMAPVVCCLRNRDGSDMSPAGCQRGRSQAAQIRFLETFCQQQKGFWITGVHEGDSPGPGWHLKHR
jgi:pimeloyl-ACP methyl ester carboxylesterase